MAHSRPVQARKRPKSAALLSSASASRWKPDGASGEVASTQVLAMLPPMDA
ncbi:hypothetical protein [Lapillicoccus sp.]|uniref:hypothetical protein n=1 Tax=Lapillicoccus sp. TaxID=1909287 RepID=UPI0025DAF257|nr:hypothetical protein [Lapillicoccus sp.]